MDAHRELQLSKQFPNYLGHSNSTDENYYLHFIEL